MSRQFELDLKSWRQLTENDDSPHDPPRGPRDLLGGVRRFTSGENDGLGTGVREGSRDERTVESSSAAERNGTNAMLT